MNISRSSGVLLHPTSLPGLHGIGDLGPEAYAFLDWLAVAGFHYWQFLPLGPTGYGNSPYQCHSVFAGNPNLISPQLLVRDGLLLRSDIDSGIVQSDHGSNGSGTVDFGVVISWKRALLRKALVHFERHATASLHSEFEDFKRENGDWLEDYTMFMALKSCYRERPVLEWPRDARSPDSAAKAGFTEQLREEARSLAFNQWLFFRQWRQLREYGRRLGVKLIGDAPVFAALDSADVWANPNLFLLDESGVPTVVAGVPPDYFAPTGQFWGNPLYDWRAHKRSGYAWWIRRARSLLQLVDLVRLDHFRGFAGYWEIPASAPTAESGKWQAGPAEDFLDALVRAIDVNPERPNLPLIAEDLGVVTPDVRRLLRKYDLPGMRVLQFAFTGYQDDFLPHNFPEQCVAYTGTHDNDTSRGWFSSAPESEKEAALSYLASSESMIVADMIAAIWRSPAVLTIVPVQDILDLGSEARMNYPGKTQGYWEWRLRSGSLTESLALKCRSLNEAWGRLAPEHVQASD